MTPPPGAKVKTECSYASTPPCMPSLYAQETSTVFMLLDDSHNVSVLMPRGKYVKSRGIAG
jgi:pyrimidine deaminase RibD-like protein